MKRWKIGLIGVLLGVLLAGFASVAMAAYDPTPKILSKLQGPWYDSAGNVVLNFDGNTVNSCQIVGAYNEAGGGYNFSCIIRIVEADGYRDLPVICENVSKDSYHAHVILNGDNFDQSKGTLLMRTKQPQHYESVGGIGLDTYAKEVLANYGKPDVIKPIKDRGNKTIAEEWTYNKMGLQLEMRRDMVSRIRILKNGNRHFDRTGFNCANALYEFQSAYGFRSRPRAGQFGSYSVGHSEYMWFDHYPDSIELNTYPN